MPLRSGGAKRATRGLGDRHRIYGRKSSNVGGLLVCLLEASPNSLPRVASTPLRQHWRARAGGEKFGEGWKTAGWFVGCLSSPKAWCGLLLETFGLKVAYRSVWPSRHGRLYRSHIPGTMSMGAAVPVARTSK